MMAPPASNNEAPPKSPTLTANSYSGSFAAASPLYSSPTRPNHITQMYSQQPSTPNTPNIDIHDYQQIIRLALSTANDSTSQPLIYEDVIVHPSHPFGSEFWKTVLSQVKLPHPFSSPHSFNFLDDIFPLVYQTIFNLNIGLVLTNHGVIVSRKISKQVNVTDILPPNITNFVNHKIYKHLGHSGMGGGDGDHDGNDDGDDGPEDDDDLSSDEEPEEKASADDETNYLLGLRESVKTCIKDTLIKNRKLASTLALIRLFQDVVKSVVRAMSDHHYKLATQHRTLTHLADHLNRDGDTNDTTAMVCIPFLYFNIPFYSHLYLNICVLNNT